MGRTDQHPFAADVVMAPQQELPGPVSLLDLTEDRLDRDLAFGVQTSPALGAQRATHAVRDREPPGNPAVRRRRACPFVCLPIRRDQGRTAHAVRAWTFSSLK